MDSESRKRVIERALRSLNKTAGVTRGDVGSTAESALTGSAIAGGLGAAAGGAITHSLLKPDHAPGSLLSGKGRGLATLIAALLSGYYAARHVGMPVGALHGASKMKQDADDGLSKEERDIIELLRGHR